MLGEQVPEIDAQGVPALRAVPALWAWPQSDKKRARPCGATMVDGVAGKGEGARGKGAARDAQGAQARAGHSAAEAKAYTAEKNTALLRLAVIVFGVLVYYLWFRGQGIPWLAATVSVVAMVYALVDVLGQPYKRFPILLTSAWTAVTDGALIMLWLHATGDIDSPFFPLWYLSIVAVSFRYDWRATLAAGFVYVASYVGLLAATGALPERWPEVVVRNGYLLLLAFLAAVLARETTRTFEERFHLGQQVLEASRFRALADATPEGILVTRGGVILEANRAVSELVGRSRDELVGHQGLEFVDDASRPAVLERLSHPSDEPLDVWLTRPGGARRVMRIQGRDMAWEGQPARVVSVRDVTVERAAEEARQRALQVDMEVARLREMDHFKGEFINAAAHELNTPLTPIKLELHVLKASMAGAPESQRRSIELVDRNINRLGTLVDDMLDVARLQSGRLRMEPRPCDLSRLVRETCETFAQMAAARQVALSCDADGPLAAMADEKRITQVLYNLLSNALKFTAPGGSVKVVARRDGGVASIEVQDSGVGLSPEQAARLFHPFVQLHREQVMAPGTGLGLYISRGIAERHGGTLACTSPGPGRGATFTLGVPALDPAAG